MFLSENTFFFLVKKMVTNWTGTTALTQLGLQQFYPALPFPHQYNVNTVGKVNNILVF